jgi:hypothetical protein
MARENSGWGYDRIVGALSNLGHVVSDQTVGNILRRHGIPPAPKRSQNTNWKALERRAEQRTRRPKRLPAKAGRLIYD